MAKLLENLRDMSKLVQAYDKGLVAEREAQDRGEQLLAWAIYDLTDSYETLFAQRPAAAAGEGRRNGC
jgi:hypothetical protein